MLRLVLLLFAIGAAEPSANFNVGASIAEVRSFAKSEGDKLWPGYGSAPFEFLLIAGDKEELLCRSKAPNGFTANGTDHASGCPKFARARSGLPDSLLAAMPVFGPPSTIVMGTPQATGRSEADWTRTILHEHFHEWQDSLAGFYDRVAKLDLSGGDETGMWMLNFPFPYAAQSTKAAFVPASRALATALDARGTPAFRERLNQYLAARRKLADAVGEKNWRYAELELWKEGVARWTEIELGKSFPNEAVQASARELERNSRLWLDKADIAGAGREFVYPFGASEAMLLEACGSQWRQQYPNDLALGPMLETAARYCRG